MAIKTGNTWKQYARSPFFKLAGSLLLSGSLTLTEVSDDPFWVSVVTPLEHDATETAHSKIIERCFIDISFASIVRFKSAFQRELSANI
jgi:hypothetical protein